MTVSQTGTPHPDRESARDAGASALGEALRLGDDIGCVERQIASLAQVLTELRDKQSVGLQLLHTMVGDRPDGLLLVGDGQQAVYPGGFTLAEAGISVAGRAVVLDRN